jgi:predicted N-acetyltransferase YhbS
MTPFVRLAVPADDRSIGDLLVRAFVERYATKLPQVVVTGPRKASLRDVAGKRASARIWVAERDGQVVGTVSLFPPGAAGSEAWIAGAADLRHLAVEPALHGQGVARLLLDVAEGEARALGASAVCLHVRREATGVRRLYEARGYHPRPEGDLDLRPEVYLSALALPLGSLS